MRYAVIMAGGTGTRFWPESRESMPKQLLRIGSEQTLMERTVRRIEPLLPAEQMMVVTGDSIAEKIAAGTPGLLTENLISEPLRRNTAPCVALACRILMERDPYAVVVVLAADHLIKDEELFRRIIDAAMVVAAGEEVLITLGIKPTYPETGYGYIEMGERAGEQKDLPYHHVTAFHEKPDAETAQKYVNGGNFFWNSGMFVFRASAYWQATEQHLPQLAADLGAIDCSQSPARIKQQVDDIYPRLEAVSVDVGIMEKADNLHAFPADIGWSDVGSWTTLREFLSADGAGNVAHGDHLFMNGSRENIVFARDGMVVAIGVEDLIIVHTPDATLVARRDDAQAVKRIFDELEKLGLEKYI